MYYYTCPACGANLDSGEKCECGGESAKKFGSPDTTQADPNTYKCAENPAYNDIITQRVSFVKGIDIRKMRLAKKIPAKAMVATVHKRFPGYDVTLQSKVENPEYYGIRLLPEAEAALIREYAPDAVQHDRRRDRHKLTNRVSCRLTDELYSELTKFAFAGHYANMNACLIDLIRMAVAQNKKEDIL